MTARLGALALTAAEKQHRYRERLKLRQDGHDDGNGNDGNGNGNGADALTEVDLTTESLAQAGDPCLPRSSTSAHVQRPKVKRVRLTAMPPPEPDKGERRQEITLDEACDLLDQIERYRDLLGSAEATLQDWLTNSEEFAAAFHAFARAGGTSGEAFRRFTERAHDDDG